MTAKWQGHRLEVSGAWSGASGSSFDTDLRSSSEWRPYFRWSL